MKIELKSIHEFLKNPQVSQSVINEDILAEENLFEATADKTCHLGKATGHLMDATAALQNKDTSKFHSSMAGYHTAKAKHHSVEFDKHIDHSISKASNAPEKKRHEDLAWAHSDMYYNHKALADSHVKHMNKAGGKLTEEVETMFKSLNEDAVASATPNSATNIAQKDMPLGKLEKRKPNLDEAGLNPATRPPTAPSMSKSNDSLPSKRKSLGKLKEEAPSAADELNHKMALDHYAQAEQHKNAGDGHKFHSSMADHHTAMMDHHANKGEHDLANKHRKAGDRHSAHAANSAISGKIYEAEDYFVENDLLNEEETKTTYASVAAKHKFKVKSPSQNHLFNHDDHGSVTVNREKDTWTHVTKVPSGVRQKPVETSGKGADALDSHLRKNHTNKSVFM